MKIDLKEYPIEHIGTILVFCAWGNLLGLSVPGGAKNCWAVVCLGRISIQTDTESFFPKMSIR